MSNSPFDLFRQPPKKPRSPPQTGAVPPTPSKEAAPAPAPSFTTSAEYKEIYDKVSKMHDDLEKQLAEMFQQSGWSLQKIKQYLENPNNFNQFEWSRIQQEREHWNKQIWNIVGESGKARVISQEKKKAAEGKKGKLLGARKNWIPIR